MVGGSGTAGPRRNGTDVERVTRMKTQGVVLSLAVTDATRSHDFYREVLGADMRPAGGGHRLH